MHMADGAAGGKEEADLEEKVGAGSGAGDAGDSELLVWADLDDAATGALLSDEARADVDAQYRCVSTVGDGWHAATESCVCAYAWACARPWVCSGQGVRVADVLQPHARMLSDCGAHGTRQLAGVMGLEDYETNPRRHILLDFHFYNLQCVACERALYVAVRVRVRVLT